MFFFGLIEALSNTNIDGREQKAFDNSDLTAHHLE